LIVVFVIYYENVCYLTGEVWWVLGGIVGQCLLISRWWIVVGVYGDGGEKVREGELTEATKHDEAELGLVVLIKVLFIIFYINIAVKLTSDKISNAC